MNDDRSLERFLADRLGDSGIPLPDAFYDDLHTFASRTRRRPHWLALIKEDPMRYRSRVAVGSPPARMTALAAVTMLVAILGAGAIVVGAQPSPSPLPDEAGASGLVTEEVEPGVERIISDGAGHDLEERHPTYRYDMDDVFVTPDGTVWLATSYRDTDNDANPPGGLVWALGQSGTAQYPGARFCFPGVPDNEEAPGVTCFDPATETQTRYLTGTSINAVAAAPDGTFWAVGSDGVENGGLYHITPE